MSFLLCIGGSIYAAELSQPLKPKTLAAAAHAQRVHTARPDYVGSEPVPPTRVQFIHVDTRFESVRKKCRLMVVYFYELGKDDRTIKTARWTEVDRNFTAFHRASRVRRYAEAGICFVAVNLTRDNLGRYRQEYKLRGNDSVVLFRDGVPYGKEDLAGAFNEKDVRSFIDDYFDDFITYEIDRQKEQEERRARADDDSCADGSCVWYSQPRLGVYSYSWPGYWYGYPYSRWWYGYPGWYGGYGYPGVGFGVSFGL